MTIKTYSELITLPTFEDRLAYLKLDSSVADSTFGGHRWVNQKLYTSKEWRTFRNKVIVRDNGCDLGVDGLEINEHILIHHINPLTIDDVLNRSPNIFDMNNVICVSKNTHNYIHYGIDNFDNPYNITIRFKNDQIPWKV